MAHKHFSRLLLWLLIVIIGLMGFNVQMALALDTVTVPVLVNIQGFKGISADEKKILEDTVKQNIADANRILERECTDCKLVLEVAKIKWNPDGATTVHQGASETSKLTDEGKKELDSELGKGKGQKIYIVDQVLKDDGEEASGLGADGEPVAYIPFGTLAVQPIRDKETGNIIGYQGIHGHYIVHELLHNAGLTDRDHTSNGSLFDETLDSGTRAKKRTMMDDQCKKLKAYFKSRGTTTREAASGEKTSLRDYDSNSDAALDNSEFFAMVDDWIGGLIENSLFFEGIDLWISSGSASAPPSNGSVSPTPPFGNPLPANLGALCYVGHLPESCGSLRLTTPEATIGIGFRQRIELPSGSTVTWQVTTLEHGVQLQGGRAIGTLNTNEILSGSVLTVIGTATRDTVLDSDHAALDLFLTVDVSGILQVMGSISRPDGSESSFSLSIQVIGPFITSQDTRPMRIIDLQTFHRAALDAFEFSVLGHGIERISLAIFDLSGRELGVLWAKGANLIWNGTARNGRPLASAIYLYRVVAIGIDGSTKSSGIKKLILVRD